MTDKPESVSALKMAEIESRASEEVCLVLTASEFQHLTLQQFSMVAIENLSKGVSYRFIIPDDSTVIAVFEQFRNSILPKRQESKAKIKYVAANVRAMGLMTPVALFDPHRAEGEGYLRHFAGRGYSWLRMDRVSLESALSGFEYFWSTQPVTRRFFPSLPDQTIPSLVREDYEEASNCALLGQNRAAITLFARVLEGILRLYAQKNNLEIEPNLGLGQLLSRFKSLDNHPFGKKQLNVLGYAINEYRIESVHVKEASLQPDDNDVNLVWSAIRKLLEAFLRGIEDGNDKHSSI